MKVKRPKYLVLVLVLLGMVCGLASATSHTVKKGETFYRIAQAYGVSVEKLMSFNGFSDASKLQVGRSLKIPGQEVKVATRVEHVRAKPVAQVAKNLRVVLDPGHGGRDRGAIWGGVHEADLNLKVALRVEDSLKGLGYRVTMTRRSDVFVTLARRAQIANSCGNAIFVSIHFNATKHTEVRGAETFYAGTKGGILAKSIQGNLVSQLKVRNRGSRFKKYSVLHQTSCPAVLVECGFISNSYERSRCKTASYQAAAARAIVTGIQSYDRRN